MYAQPCGAQATCATSAASAMFTCPASTAASVHQSRARWQNMGMMVSHWRCSAKRRNSFTSIRSVRSLTLAMSPEKIS